LEADEFGSELKVEQAAKQLFSSERQGIEEMVTARDNYNDYGNHYLNES
jgi:hypothetical protein